MALLEHMESWTRHRRSWDAPSMGGQREGAGPESQESRCLWPQILHHRSGNKAGNAPEHSPVMMQLRD